MKRRNFIKGLALGTVAGAALPLTSLGSESGSQGSGHSRDSKEAFVERFTGDSRVRSGMALGGIGAGTFELRKDGCFYNWSIFNNFPKETGSEFKLPNAPFDHPMDSNLFFKVRYEVEGEEPRLKLLQLPNGMNEGGEIGIAYTFPWMQAVESIEYSARFPFATLKFTASDMPFDIVMTAWTPFIPHDVKNSALPVAYFDFTIMSRTSKRIDVMLMMSARNNAGYDTPDRYYVTEVRKDASLVTVNMSCGGMNEKSPTWGQIALSSLAGDSTYYCGWSHLHPYYEYVLRHSTLPNIDDTNGTESIKAALPAWMPPGNGRNFIDPKTGRKMAETSEFDPDSRLFCTLARSFQLEGEESQQTHSFIYSWNFPNLYADNGFQKLGERIEGHYYSNFFSSSVEAADYAAAQRADLHRRSKEFLDNFFDSSADLFVLEQVNSQLNTFATNGRLVKSGDFGILEGLSLTWSWGPIGTIDVMLYGTAPIIALFPELQKSTMRCHSKAQNEQGQLAHGLAKNFPISEDGLGKVSERIDLPGQYVIMAVRDFLWTNDREYLNDMYPSIKKAIEYVLDYRCFGDGQIPVMKGKGDECSYDNFPMYGYSAYVTSQWMCALASAAKAAEVMGDDATRAKYLAILQKVQTLMEQQLWSGKYYKLYNDQDKAGGRGNVSEACLTDQIIGQWAAHQSGLGRLLKKENVETSLKSILQANYKPDFGLRNCSWPGTKYWAEIEPRTWVDQGNTCWSGVELAFASFLLYEGFLQEALDVVKTVDERYRKNGLYWDHQEFGGHYFRPMSAWSIVNGLLGFSVQQGKLRFDPQLRQSSFKLFFATPTGTGHYIGSPGEVVVKCLTGTLRFNEVELRGIFMARPALSRRSLNLAQSGTRTEPGFTNWEFDEMISLNPGEEIVFR